MLLRNLKYALGGLASLLTLTLLVIYLTPLGPPDEVVSIPSEIPESLWGHQFPMLTEDKSYELPPYRQWYESPSHPGWTRIMNVDYAKSTATWRWEFNREVIFRYSLQEGRCVQIGKVSVKLVFIRHPTYIKFRVEECSIWPRDSSVTNGYSEIPSITQGPSPLTLQGGYTVWSVPKGYMKENNFNQYSESIVVAYPGDWTTLHSYITYKIPEKGSCVSYSSTQAIPTLLICNFSQVDGYWLKAE